MRLEATLPDNRGQALNQLAEDLGMSRSQIVDEAVGLFLKAVLEIRRGHRLVSLDGTNHACELSTPTLATLEWAAQARPLLLPIQEIETIQKLIAQPGEPGERLRTAARRVG